MSILLYFSTLYNIVLGCFIVGLCKCINNTQIGGVHLGANHTFEYNIPILKTDDIDDRFISIIIACKNEAHNLPYLISALKNQHYPKDRYEVILADDGSTDATKEVILSLIADEPHFHYHYVDPATYPEIVGKKKAITSAVLKSKGEILAFTDADCLPMTDWLADINNSIVTDGFYAGYSPLLRGIMRDETEVTSGDNNDTTTTSPIPVPSPPTSCLPPLLNLERASIFAVTAASFGLGIPLTCTARNIAYTRTLWDKVDGFSGINHIRSGDDDLMLQKMRKYIKKYYFSFNLNATVPSVENKNLSGQIDTETRRASKFRYYPLYIKMLLLSIAIYYGLLLFYLCLVLGLCPLPQHPQWILALGISPHSDLCIAIGSKLVLEFTLLSIFLQRVKQVKLLNYFIIAELLYIPYFLLFGLWGTIGKYKWKS